MHRIVVQQENPPALSYQTGLVRWISIFLIKKGNLNKEFWQILFMCNILSLSATPGRLNDLLMNEIMDVRSVTYLVSLNHFLILNF